MKGDDGGVVEERVWAVDVSLQTRRGRGWVVSVWEIWSWTFAKEEQNRPKLRS